MSLYQALADLETKGLSGALCTVIDTQGSTPRHEGSKMLVYPDGRIIGTVGGGEIENQVIRQALDALRDGKTRLLTYSLVDPSKGDVGVCGGQVQVFIEPLLSPPYLLIIGSGHVGKALAHLGKWLGFRVGVSDDRVELCNKENIPDADEYLPYPISELPNKTDITNRFYIVLTTRGSDIDIQGLPAILQTRPAYLGIIGSKRRWAVTKKTLIKKGVSEEQLAGIHSPIGLELHAETPEEIAISIMAEITMLRYGANGKSMKE